MTDGGIGRRTHSAKLSKSEEKHSSARLATDVASGRIYVLLEGTSPASKGTASCKHCRQRRSCRTTCRDIQRLLPNDRTGSGEEFTNEVDLDGRVAVPASGEGLDYSKVLEVPHIYTARQLAALRLLHQGRARSEVCRKLGVNGSRVSQLVSCALERHRDYEAEMRARIILKLRQFNCSAPREEEA
jgi:DNA-binding CsgD family transcriptional regulator